VTARPDLAALEHIVACMTERDHMPQARAQAFVAAWHGFDTWETLVAACSAPEGAQKN
jgi:hypothetical protein